MSTKVASMRVGMRSYAVCAFVCVGMPLVCVRDKYA